MKLKFAWLNAVFLLTGILNLAFAQSLSLTGTVINKSGDLLAGATVQVKGSKSGTSTNAQGAFTINVPKAGTTLVFSFIHNRL